MWPLLPPTLTIASKLFDVQAHKSNPWKKSTAKVGDARSLGAPACGWRGRMCVVLIAAHPATGGWAGELNCTPVQHWRYQGPARGVDGAVIVVRGGGGGRGLEAGGWGLGDMLCGWLSSLRRARVAPQRKPNRRLEAALRS